ncbi:family 16 glycosylhydrolase, partial [Tropicimonas isoalkanivorans]
FLFNNTFWSADHHNEIDFEFLGGDTTVVNINYYYDDMRMGAENGPVQIDLGYDAAEEMHTYGFDWQEDSIAWYIDGVKVYEVTSETSSVPIPDEKMKIVMDVWSGTFDNWHGVLSDDLKAGKTTAAYYSRVSYDANGAPYDDSGKPVGGEDPSGTPVPEPETPAPETPVTDGDPAFDHVGTNANESLYGDSGTDSIDGGRGDDFVAGRGAADLLTGGAGNDIVRAGGGNDTLVYVVGRNYGVNDVYKGAAGVDTLKIFATEEELADGKLAADIRKLKAFIADNYDSDTNKGPAFDFASNGLRVRGIEKVELVKIGCDGSGVVTCDDETNETGALPSFDRVGHAGNETLKGGGSADSIYGAGGDDYILGRGSVDILAGGAGDDVIKGGARRDVLIYEIGNNTGAEDRYEGSAGFDRLKIYGTEAELKDDAFLDDIAALEQFMSDNYDTGTNGGPTYEFDSLGLSVRSIEAVELVLIEDWSL